MLDGAQRRFAHHQHIVAIHPFGFHIERARLAVDFGHRRVNFQGCAHRIEIIFAHKNHRQFPELCKVKRLVELAAVGGAIAEKHHHDRVSALHFHAERYADRQRQMAADDRISAPEILAHVCKMHRTAQPFGAAGHFAEQFCHQRIDVESARNSMAVVAVMGKDMIFGAQRRNGADRRRLFADVQMEKTADSGFGVHLLTLLLEASD